MAWVTTFLQDTAIPGVGTVAATFTELGDSFVYQRRIDTSSGDDIAAFVSEAEAAKSKRTQDTDAVTSARLKIENALNGA